MTKEWETRLQCETCFTVVTYRNEKPEWRDSLRHLVDMEEARQFVEANPVIHAKTARPRLVGLQLHPDEFGGQAYVIEEKPPLVAECPACGGETVPVDLHGDKE